MHYVGSIIASHRIASHRITSHRIASHVTLAVCVVCVVWLAGWLAGWLVWLIHAHTLSGQLPVSWSVGRVLAECAAIHFVTACMYVRVIMCNVILLHNVINFGADVQVCMSFSLINPILHIRTAS
jgi:hypothetical protein